MATLPPTEFSQEAVRQLMLANGGRITNHELVKSFKRWLTDPSCREEARMQFKDFVNNLATIRQEDGEKYLVLKKKYFPEYYGNDKSQIIKNQYQQEFYTNNPEKMYERSSYPAASPSSGYVSSSSPGVFPSQSPGYVSSPNYSLNGPSSLTSPPQVTARSSSPSLLDEVMAGFNPPSRSMGRQPSSLPPVPQSYNPQGGGGGGGYQSSPRGYQGQPPPPQSSYQNSPRGSSYNSSNGTNSITSQPQQQSSSSYSNNFAQQQPPPHHQPRYSEEARYNGFPGGQQPPHHRNSNPIPPPQYGNSNRQQHYDNSRTSLTKDGRYNEPNDTRFLESRQSNRDLRYNSDSQPPYLPERQLSRSELPVPQPRADPRFDRQMSAPGPGQAGGLGPGPVSGLGPGPGGGLGSGPGDGDYNPGQFSPHFVPNSRYSVSSTASHSSGGSYLPPNQFPGPGQYHGGGQVPGQSPGAGTRTNSSPLPVHQPYQPVFPDASQRSTLYSRTMSNSALSNPLGYSSPTLPPTLMSPTNPAASPPQRPLPHPHHPQDGGGVVGLPPPSSGRTSVTSLEQSADPGGRRKPDPPPYRPPPPEVGLPPRPGGGAGSRQNSVTSLPPRSGSTMRPNGAPPPIPNIDPRRNSTASIQSSGLGLPPPTERPSRLDVNPPDLGLPPPTKPRPLHNSAGSRPDQASVGLPVISNQKSSGSLSKSYGNLTATSAIADEDKENYRLEASQSVDNLSEEVISVRERTKTFNRMASDVSLTGSSSKLSSIVKRRNSRAIEMNSMARRGSAHSASGREDESLPDTSSITTLDPTIKAYMIQAAKGDYQTLAKMLSENPKLVRHKDLTSGYTGLHWAAKHGNMDMVKLVAGSYKANVNARTHGGYTPLHLAAQHGHQDVFDLLVGAYGADANIRDNSGKKARQYMLHSDNNSSTLSLSSDTFGQLKDRRRTRTNRLEKNQGGGMLRFGSISVKVKKTTEAFNNYFNSGGSSNNSSFEKRFDDTQKMPPPKFAPIKKRKSKRTIDFGLSRSAPTTPVGKPAPASIPEVEERNSDSDSEFGFGNSCLSVLWNLSACFSSVSSI